MNLEKQSLLVSYMLSDNDLFARCNSIVDTNYFDPEIRQSVYFIKEYYEKYRALPSSDQVKAESGNDLPTKQLTKAESEYAITEIETYCRNKAIESAILAAPKLLANQDFGKIEKIIRDAISVALNKELGLDYFANPEERLKKMLQLNKVISTGYYGLDQHLNGGISRKELLLLMAGSGVGKSIVMSNLAVNFLNQKLNVCYITLELAEEVVAKRLDSMVTGIAQKDIFEKMTKIATDLERKKDAMGKFFIKRMPESTTSANMIRAYLKEFEMAHGFIPDVLIIDYMDLMTSNHKISAENLFVKDKYVAEELRSISNDYNMLLVSASQMNRSAIGADDIDQSNIAGGLSKINTCDNLIAIIQNDAMKAQGEYMFKFVKTRNSNGVGKHVVLRWDPISLRITDTENTRDKLEFVKKTDAGEMPVKQPKRSILDLMNV
jgi:KaiC/GvpD/RAD55 family RecA-like ATPase